MSYNPKKYESLLGLQGFSDALLKNHFTLYEGYVKNVNLIMKELELMVKENKTGTPAHSEIQRRFGWEWNGMRLHELYFENLTKSPSPLNHGQLKNYIEKSYGNFEVWEKDFRALASMRGIGWVILYRDSLDNKLFNVWVNEHDMGHLSGLKPLLVLDVFEHAYTLDYGIKKADYLETFMKSIDWTVVEKRI